MPSVAHASAPQGVEFGYQQKLPEPASSGFTAVNGRGSPSQAAPTNGMLGEPSPPRSRQTSDDGPDRKPRFPHQSDWQYPTTKANGVHRITPPSEAREGAVIVSAGKRKRPSPDGSDDSPSPIRVLPGNIPMRVETTDLTLDEDSSVHRTGSGSSANHSLSPNTVGDNQSRAWHSSDRSATMNSDGRFGESLQREPVRAQAQGPTSEGGSPVDGTIVVGGSQNVQSSTTEMTRAGVQVDPKKRKRQFANRTKTGCQTCRRRKKKCDEAKPECMNCIRGGFICEGYIHKSPWVKPGTNKGPVPLQSKDGYPDNVTLYHRHGGTEPYDDRNATQPSDGIRTRPIAVDEQDRQPARGLWSNPWAEPSHRPYVPDQTTSTQYSQPSLVPDHARSHPPPEHPASSSIVQRSTAPPAYPPPVQSMNGSHSAPTAHISSQPPSTASHPAQTQPQSAPAKSEKDKMLAGEYYKPYTPQLVDEREQCKTALWRFNNATNPSTGVSREERARLFRAVLEVQRTRHLPATGPTGSLGRDVCVEAPFTCEYGYNIHIGDEVVIGSNCTILDPCRVVIGPRAIIGPNVQIYGNTVPTDPRSRRGTQGTQVGREIFIDEDVFIGGGVTILPGVHIGKGSTIGAGSVVTHNVPPFTVAMGTPAKVVRGIWLDQSTT